LHIHILDFKLQEGIVRAVLKFKEKM